jgi:long-chain fatty acid transport protein
VYVDACDLLENNLQAADFIADLLFLIPMRPPPLGAVRAMVAFGFPLAASFMLNPSMIVLGSTSPQSLTVVPKYKNTWHVAIGAQYRLTEQLKLLLGYAYDSAAVSAKNRPLDFPIGSQLRYSAGMQWQLSSALAINADFTLMRQGNLAVDVERGPLADRVSGAYKNSYVQFFNLNLQ